MQENSGRGLNTQPSSWEADTLPLDIMQGLFYQILRGGENINRKQLEP